MPKNREVRHNAIGFEADKKFWQIFEMPIIPRYKPDSPQASAFPGADDEPEEELPAFPDYMAEIRRAMSEFLRTKDLLEAIRAVASKIKAKGDGPQSVIDAAILLIFLRATQDKKGIADRKMHFMHYKDRLEFTKNYSEKEKCREWTKVYDPERTDLACILMIMGYHLLNKKTVISEPVIRNIEPVLSKLYAIHKEQLADKNITPVKLHAKRFRRRVNRWKLRHKGLRGISLEYFMEVRGSLEVEDYRVLQKICDI